MITLHQVVSGGNKYGENVTVKVSPLSFNLIDIRAKAGETASFLPIGIDGITGFSKGEEIKGEEFAFSPMVFQAKEGDVIMIRSNDAEYSPQIFFDSNGNGTMDWGANIYFGSDDSSEMDELIFSEKRYDGIDPTYTDIVPIHRNGTYFFFVMNLYGGLELCHLKNRCDANASMPMKIKAPEQAGTYLGIAEKNGNLIPIPVKLLVEAGEPTSIFLDTANRTDPNLLFEVKLEVQDKFGNLVENDTATAVIEFNGTTKNVDLVKGKDSINLTAPEKTGIYKIKAQSRYGISEKDIEIIDKVPIETGNNSINSTEIEEKMNQIGDTRGPASTKQIKDLPKKVESVSSILTSGNISLTWQASEDADYYNVYRLKGASLEKLAEVKSPEYTLKGELWKSYTFRVSAVNREGNESELSDPVGIVVTP